MTLPPPPRFLGANAPGGTPTPTDWTSFASWLNQFRTDWLSLQKWFTALYNFLTLEGSVFSFSTNIAYDTPGTPDTRPGTWGNAAYVDSQIPFTAVPAGCQVVIKRVYGTWQGWVQNPVPGTPSAQPAGSNSGTLFGLLITGAGQSPFVGPGLGSSGNPLYFQNQTGNEGFYSQFDVSFNANNVLAADNILTLRQAIYLNNTGMSIHQEISLVIEFQYAGPGQIN